MFSTGERPILDVIFLTLEDGGEHLAVSFILCYVYSISMLTKEELRLTSKAI